MQSRHVSFGGESGSFRTRSRSKITMANDNSTNMSKNIAQASPISPSKDQSWRKHGRSYRAKIIAEDEKRGGNSFILSNQCSIDRYYRVAEKVLDSFLSSSSTSSSPKEVSEAYLVGNRLVKFLSVVLPTHEEYLSENPNLTQRRARSQEQLVDLLQYMEELALILDEIQYNLYILNDLTPLSTSKTTNSFDWTESTANETSLEESNCSDKEDNKTLQDVNVLQKRVAAVLTAAENEIFQDDFFNEAEDDFDIQSTDFSFQASFADFDFESSNDDNMWPSPERESWQNQNNNDWFLPSETKNTACSKLDKPQRNVAKHTTTTPAKDTKHSIPKVKPPRSAPPRSLVRLMTSPTQQIFYPEVSVSKKNDSLLDSEPFPVPMSKIEGRFERAAKLQQDEGDYEVMDGSSEQNKRLLKHFKGCVRFLLD